MATCPLCNERTAKRYCPAKAEPICAVCCGIKREIEIDCPGDCIHLQAGRSYEAEKRALDPELSARVRSLNRDSFKQHTPILEGVTRQVVDERLSSQWLVDSDVLEVYRALTATLKTLSNGIYYESLPDRPHQLPLYRRLKQYFDQLMMPQANSASRTLKVSELLQIMDFLTLAAQLNSGSRPRSRRYLDLLVNMSSTSMKSDQSSGLILP
jgi:hypothetical protein